MFIYYDVEEFLRVIWSLFIFLYLMVSAVNLKKFV